MDLSDIEKRRFSGSEENSDKKQMSGAANPVIDWSSAPLNGEIAPASYKLSLSRINIVCLGMIQFGPVQQEMDCPQSKVGLVIGSKVIVLLIFI